jgi:hypothetical protein
MSTNTLKKALTWGETMLTRHSLQKGTAVLKGSKTWKVPYDSHYGVQARTQWLATCSTCNPVATSPLDAASTSRSQILLHAEGNMWSLADGHGRAHRRCRSPFITRVRSRVYSHTGHASSAEYETISELRSVFLGHRSDILHLTRPRPVSNAQLLTVVWFHCVAC